MSFWVSNFWKLNFWQSGFWVEDEAIQEIHSLAPRERILSDKHNLRLYSDEP